MNFNLKNNKLLTSLILGSLFYALINNTEHFLGLLNSISSYFSVFFTGLILAFLLNPLLKLFEKKLGLSRKLSLNILYLGLLFLILILIFIIIPRLVKNTSDIVNVFPNYLYMIGQKVEKYSDKYLINIPEVYREAIKGQIDKFNNQALIQIQNVLKGLGTNIMSATFSVVEFFMALIFSIFFLGQKEYFKDLSLELSNLFLKKGVQEKLIFFINKTNEVFLSYLYGKSLDSFIIGLIALAILNILNIPYSIFLWIFITFSNFIPYFGPFLGILIACIITAFSFPSKVFIVFILLLALQQFDAWYLEPKILGKKLQLKMCWTIFAITLGGKLAGPVGIIISAPIAGLIKTFYEIYKNKKNI